eukprot:evm.model.scf_2828.2 EVM.evm.TU.scf_2828.2   scf_2828:5697-6131(+)
MWAVLCVYSMAQSVYFVLFGNEEKAQGPLMAAITSSLCARWVRGRRLRGSWAPNRVCSENFCWSAGVRDCAVVHRVACGLNIKLCCISVPCFLFSNVPTILVVIPPNGRRSVHEDTKERGNQARRRKIFGGKQQCPARGTCDTI